MGAGCQCVRRCPLFCIQMLPFHLSVFHLLSLFGKDANSLPGRVIKLGVMGRKAPVERKRKIKMEGRKRQDWDIKHSCPWWHLCPAVAVL